MICSWSIASLYLLIDESSVDILTLTYNFLSLLTSPSFLHCTSISYPMDRLTDWLVPDEILSLELDIPCMRSRFSGR
jgi:hypothetical protein